MTSRPRQASDAAMPGARNFAPETQCLVFLREHITLTASELTRLTSLSRPTVDAALRSLETAQLVDTTLSPTGKAGRPAKTYTFTPQQRMLGVDIGQHTVRAVATDLTGRILSTHETERTREPSRDNFLQDLDEAITAVLQGAPVAGIGLAVPGIVKDQHIKLSRVLPYLNDWDFRKEIESLTNSPIHVSNDVKAAALGEAQLGSGTADSSQVTVWLGRRVSTAVTFHGEIFEGANGLAGEITAAAGTNWTPGSVYGEWTWPQHRSPLENAEAALAGDEEAAESLHAYLDGLSDPLSRLIAILDPEVLVIAGVLSETKAPLPEYLASHLQERLTVPFLPRIKNSRYGRFSAAVGALYTVFTHPVAATLGHWQLPAPTTLVSLPHIN